MPPETNLVHPLADRPESPPGMPVQLTITATAEVTKAADRKDDDDG